MKVNMGLTIDLDLYEWLRRAKKVHLLPLSITVNAATREYLERYFPDCKELETQHGSAHVRKEET